MFHLAGPGAVVYSMLDPGEDATKLGFAVLLRMSLQSPSFLTQFGQKVGQLVAGAEAGEEAEEGAATSIGALAF